MNFKITHNWLLEYIDTDAKPEEIQDFLSLTSVNVETLTKVGSDTVYDIEVTANRIDCASVLGFAIECVAALPRHGKKATFRHNPLKKSLSLPTGNKLTLDLHVSDQDAVSRVACMIMSGVTVKPSPDVIRERLEACGERSINNVVDISNYLRIAYGQPVHMFDYDSIEQHKMTIQTSSPGDVVTLIDGTELKLPGGDVIVRDGSGRIIDLVGLMGGQNTEITEATQNVLLFVPIVNKTRIRKTSMTTGHRTAAISYFEKGLDEERVIPTLSYGIELLQSLAQGQPASEVYDYYPHQQPETTLPINTNYINSRIGTDLSMNEILSYLEPLGFDADPSDDPDTRTIHVPSFRAKDVTTQADVVEEVARMYGYHTIIPEVQKTDIVFQPITVRNLIDTSEKVRDFLSAIGFYEQYNYSMISEQAIHKMGLRTDDHIQLTNTLSTEIEYMRMSLLPSLLGNLAENQGRTQQLHYFEIAHSYHRRQSELPLETLRLTLVSTMPYDIMMGVFENMSNLLHVSPLTLKETYMDNWAQSEALIMNEQTELGTIGILHETQRLAWGIKSPVTFIELDVAKLVDAIQQNTVYVKPNPFAHISHDLTYVSQKESLFSEMKTQAFESSSLLQSLDVLSRFEDKITIRCTFAALDRNITEAEIVDDFLKIKNIFQHA